MNTQYRQIVPEPRETLPIILGETEGVRYSAEIGLASSARSLAMCWRRVTRQFGS